MRRAFFAFAFLLFAVTGPLPTPATAQSANDGYAPSADGAVRAIVVQPDGRAIVGGDFTKINDQSCVRLCRLHVDGSVDTSFPDPAITGGAQIAVRALALQADGKILVGGQFTSIGGQGRTNLARLNTNGSVDTGFTASANASVRTLAVQTNGAIVVGGLFDQVSGQGRNRIARLHADGSLDDDFNPGANNGVNALLPLPDGQLVVGGQFTRIGGQDRNGLARLNADGSVDGTFDPDPTGGIVLALVRQASGKIVVGGEFTAIGGQTRNRLARLNADGGLDAAFGASSPPSTNVIGFNAAVNALAVQSDGKILVGGGFDQIAGQPFRRLVRLNAHGFLDYFPTDDLAIASGSVLAVAVQPDGKAVFGGTFTSIATQTHNRIARVNLDFSLDRHFVLPANAIVHALALHPYHRVLIGGEFTRVDNILRGGVSQQRMSGNGLIGDEAVNGPVFALAAQPDGRILLGGSFTSIRGQARNNIARVNRFGGLHERFATDANGAVHAIAVQTDGRILIGGDFTSINGQARNHIARLNSDGSLDGSFNPNASARVRTLAVQADGKILIGGEFTTLAGQSRARLARLHGNGTLDAAFPVIDGNVHALALQADGRIVFGGAFSIVGGQPRNRLARLNANGSLEPAFTPQANDDVHALALQSDGKIVVGGQFLTVNGQSRQRMARLNPDGSLDTGFQANASGPVRALAVQPDGKILVGGLFSTIAGEPRSNLARLSTVQQEAQSVDVSGDDIVLWNRSGTGPEVVRPPEVALSLDGNYWMQLGLATRANGQWRGSDLPLPLGQDYFLRVKGIVSSDGASQGLIHDTRHVPVSDTLFVDGLECQTCHVPSTPGFHTSRAAFLAQVQSGYYEEDFASLPSAYTPLESFSGNGFSYEVTAAGLGDQYLYTIPGLISTGWSEDSIRITFTGAPVTAVGGSFWSSAVNLDPTGWQITLTLHDGTQETYPASGPDSFGGFITQSPISYLTITPNVPFLAFPTVSHLIVGAH